MSTTRIRITAELFPERGNPVSVRDSRLILPGEDTLALASALAGETILRAIDATSAHTTAPADPAPL